ncbi:aminotransferase class III-fold pyridoxal phosphate-dependent enzyme [bacterium]|nr:aminotransferase class III-fold pyridoxal phosphate-dependent enzyme [bacterium]
MKMSVQFWQNLGKPEKTKIGFLKGAYHGDTTGAMAVCDPDDGMHRLFSGILPKQVMIPRPPKLGASDIEMQMYFDRVERILASNRATLAALIVEPVMQGAGGFYFYPAEVLRFFRAICDRFDILLICDEVATGFGRTGMVFASDHATVVPDIMVLGKALTGGYLGLAATLARTHVWEAFDSEKDSDAFMHGPTFMGNALACAVALASIDVFFMDNYLEKIRQLGPILDELLPLKSRPGIADVRVVGGAAAVQVVDPGCLRGIQEFAVKRGVWVRPFSDIVYLTPPYIITETELKTCVGVINEFFK